MDIAIRVVLKMRGLSFKGSTKININADGDSLPEDLLEIEGSDAKYWFDFFNPSNLPVASNLSPAKNLSKIDILTDPCDSDWAKRPEEGIPLTAESLYQFTRVVWVTSDGI